MRYTSSEPFMVTQNDNQGGTAMPVRSKAQQAYLAIHHPEILHRWAKKYGTPKNLPEHVKKKK